MGRLRVPMDALSPGERRLSSAAARYVVRVHRLVKGDCFVAFDPVRCEEADAVLLQAGRDRVLVCIDAVRPATHLPLRPITLIQAVSKGSKLDAVVRDATELGVGRIVPALGERSVKRATGASHQARWQRVVLEAARQCGRGDVPVIDELKPLAEAMSAERPPEGSSLGLCMQPGAPTPMGALLRTLSSGQAVVVVVGPEGGLTEAELEQARRCAYHIVSLGQFVLRTETSGTAALGALLAAGGMSP